MNIRHLEIFVVVCEHMSISRAAEALYMSQPAVSIAIKELEEYYHCRLFDRISRKIYLTSSGEKLLNYAHVILGQIEESVTSLRNDVMTKSCHIGVNVTVGETDLCRLLDYLKIKQPDIKPHVTINNMKTIENDLVLNRYDFVITDSVPSSLNLVLEKLYCEDIVLVSGYEYVKDNEIDVSELSKYTLIKRELGSGIRKITDRFLEDKKIVIERMMESSSNKAIIELVKNGFGMSFLPYSLVKDEIEKNNLMIVEIKDCHITRDYYLVYYKNKYLSETIKENINHVIQYFHYCK